MDVLSARAPLHVSSAVSGDRTTSSGGARQGLPLGRRSSKGGLSQGGNHPNDSDGDAQQQPPFDPTVAISAALSGLSSSSTSASPAEPQRPPRLVPAATATATPDEVPKEVLQALAVKPKPTEDGHASALQLNGDAQAHKRPFSGTQRGARLLQTQNGQSDSASNKVHQDRSTGSAVGPKFPSAGGSYGGAAARRQQNYGTRAPRAKHVNSTPVELSAADAAAAARAALECSPASGAGREEALLQSNNSLRAERDALAALVRELEEKLSEVQHELQALKGQKDSVVEVAAEAS